MCWVYGPLTAAYDHSDPESALLTAADHVLARADNVPLGDYIAVENLLKTTPLGAHRDSVALARSGPLQLRRLQIIDRIIGHPEAATWMIAADPLKYAWFIAHRDLVRTYGPSGRWYLPIERYWALFEAHESTAFAEEIAWAAVHAFVPFDECYASCALAVIEQTYARYWSLFPTGPNVREALRRAADHATYGLRVGCARSPAPRESDSAREALARLDSSLVNVTAAEKVELSNRMREIERVCS